jgi:hypothetical protein
MMPANQIGRAEAILNRALATSDQMTISSAAITRSYFVR